MEEREQMLKYQGKKGKEQGYLKKQVQCGAAALGLVGVRAPGEEVGERMGMCPGVWEIGKMLRKELQEYRKPPRGAPEPPSNWGLVLGGALTPGAWWPGAASRPEPRSCCGKPSGWFPSSKTAASILQSVFIPIS